MKSQKEETPEKPDFEAMAKEVYDAIGRPDDGNEMRAYKAGMERIWNDYVASKEVEVWIDVKKRLPEPETPVLITYQFPLGNSETNISFTTKKFPDVFDHVYFDLITHWRPLPEPPNAKNTRVEKGK